MTRPTARIAAAAALATPAVLLTGGTASATIIGNAPCPAPRTLPGGTALQLCSTSSYVDSAGATHLLAFLRNPGATIESPAALISIVPVGGYARTVTAFPPVVGMRTGDTTPVDYAFDGRVTSFDVVGLTGTPASHEPEDEFGLSGVQVSSTAGQVASGTVSNDTGRDVIGIKIGYVAFTSSGVIAWYGPFVATGDNRNVAAGQRSTFGIPRRDVPSYAVIDPSSPYLFAQGNEPGVALPSAGAVTAPGASVKAVPRTTVTNSPVVGHTPVTDGGLAGGVRAPTAQDLAEAARPGTVTPSHDVVPVRRAASGSNPAIVEVAPAAAKADDGSTKWYGPVAVLVAAGLLALRMLSRDAAASREARSRRRTERESARSEPAVQPLADPDYVPPVARRPSPGSA